MNTLENGIAMMDLYVNPEVAFIAGGAQTPLAHVGLSARSAATSVSRIVRAKATSRMVAASVTLEEAPITGILVLRAGQARDQLDSALQSTLQLALPARLSSHSVGDRYCIRWMSPDEWLLTCPLNEDFDVESKLRDAVDGHIAIVNVSGGYSLLTLAGENALQILKKSTAYDVHPDNFGPGKVVNTVMAKAQVTLRASHDGAYEILVRRSFADYLWLWLQRAGNEYGLEAFSPATSSAS
jgi:sarcosine oxidase subunit gamma